MNNGLFNHELSRINTYYSVILERSEESRSLKSEGGIEKETIF